MHPQQRQSRRRRAEGRQRGRQRGRAAGEGAHEGADSLADRGVGPPSWGEPRTHNPTWTNGSADRGAGAAAPTCEADSAADSAASTKAPTQAPTKAPTVRYGGIVIVPPGWAEVH